MWKKVEHNKIITVVSQYVKTIHCCYSDPVQNISNSINITHFFVRYMCEMLKVPIIYIYSGDITGPKHITY